MTERKIALRSGEHCAKPYLRYLDQTGTLRLSIAHYNQIEDLECFLEALDLALEILAD
ncbi:cysteine desulfurase [Actinobacillus equuli]|nr:cysteine desulfurase [Actinobacillus equuli]